MNVYRNGSVGLHRCGLGTVTLIDPRAAPDTVATRLVPANTSTERRSRVGSPLRVVLKVNEELATSGVAVKEAMLVAATGSSQTDCQIPDDAV